jgi:starch synthase
LRYGTVPVVRQTGGLADTIVDANADSLREQSANGFSFADYDVGALDRTLSRAVEVYRQQPDVWRQIVETGMKQDWSWARSARSYEQLYQHILTRRGGRKHSAEISTV